jgi:hypothetical protein
MSDIINGMTEVTLTNIDTHATATYSVADVQCARMLAAEDHGGEPEDWLTADEREEVE